MSRAEYMKAYRLRHPDHPSLKTQYLMAQRSAGYRGLSFDLTFEQWNAVISHTCVYHRAGKTVKSGIDRRDSSQGYTVENSQA